MKKNTIKITLFSLMAASLVAVPAILRAQDASTNAAAATTPSTTTSTDSGSDATPAPKHKHGLPFHGTLDSMDTNAMTITVGSRTFKVTSTTKIMKDGQPAILADGVVGQPVTGAYKTDEDGTTLDAVSVRFGAHAKKHKQSADAGSDSGSSPAVTSTNSTSN